MDVRISSSPLRAAVILVGTVALVVGAVGLWVSAADPRSELMLRTRSDGAPIHVPESNIICASSPNIDFRIVPTSVGSTQARLYIEPSRAPSCKPSTPTPSAFFLSLQKKEQDQYRLLLRAEYFDRAAVTKPGQPYQIRLKLPEDLFPNFRSEPPAVIKALEELWSQDIDQPLTNDGGYFIWKPVNGESSRPTSVKFSRGVASLSTPKDWQGGDLDLTLRGDTVGWGVRGEAHKKDDQPPLTQSGPWMFGIGGWVIVGIVVLMAAGILLKVGYLPSFLNSDRRFRSNKKSQQTETAERLAKLQQATAQHWHEIAALRVGMGKIDKLSKDLETLRWDVTKLQESLPTSLPPAVPQYPVDPPRPAVLEAPREVRSAPNLRRRPNADDVEVAANLILDLIDPQGRRAPLASLSQLTDWLARDRPGIEAHPVGGLNHDLWRIVVLTADQKEGVAIPALDFTIGPGEILKWFDGGRYDGTQPLVRANVRTLARAHRSPGGDVWVPLTRGVIELS